MYQIYCPICGKPWISPYVPSSNSVALNTLLHACPECREKLSEFEKMLRMKDFLLCMFIALAGVVFALIVYIVTKNVVFSLVAFIAGIMIGLAYADRLYNIITEVLEDA